MPRYTSKSKGGGVRPEDVHKLRVGRFLLSVRCVNVTIGFTLGPNVQSVDVGALAARHPSIGIEFNPKCFSVGYVYLNNKLPALRSSLRHVRSVFDLKPFDLGKGLLTHKSLVLRMFRGGALRITGTTTAAEARVYAHQFCRVLNEVASIPAEVDCFEMTNIVSCCDLPFSVHLADMSQHSDIHQRMRYNPAVFPMACIHAEKFAAQGVSSVAPVHTSSPGIMALVSPSGSVTITGARSQSDTDVFLREVFPHLLKYRRQKGSVDTADMRSTMIMHDKQQIRHIVETLLAPGGGNPAIGMVQSAMTMGLPGPSRDAGRLTYSGKSGVLVPSSPESRSGEQVEDVLAFDFVQLALTNYRNRRTDRPKKDSVQG